jgi:hypothetical protein
VEIIPLISIINSNKMKIQNKKQKKEVRKKW